MEAQLSIFRIIAVVSFVVGPMVQPMILIEPGGPLWPLEAVPGIM
jgi:hypothetical protein